MTYLTEDQYSTERDAFRQAAIQGLDQGMDHFAGRQFRGPQHDKIEGIRDAALPEFFRVVDKAFNDALARYGFRVEGQ